MRVLFFLILIFLTLVGSSVFSEDLNTENGNSNRLSENKTNLLPEGFTPLTNGVFMDDLIFHLYEDWGIDQLLGTNSNLNTMDSDWQDWFRSRNNADSRLLLGGVPFFSLPNNRNRDEQEPTIFSADRFIFFWYFKQKF